MNASASLPRLVAILVAVFVSIPSGHGQTPNPAFPVGSLSATQYTTAGYKALLTWSVQLPDGENPANYSHFIRQVSYPMGVMWDATVAKSGQRLSSLSIDTGGSEFQLWTVRNSPLTSYLLASTFVSIYAPQATVAIRTEDPYPNLPRTRADRPFHVDVTVNGMLNGADVPDSMKSVKLLRHAQSYGAGGTGVNLDRTQATLLSNASLTENGSQTLSFPINEVPGADRAKVRGEERFSVFAVENGMAPESQLASQTLQVWPVADGAITGISSGQMIGPVVPTLTITLHDLYPSSTTWAQVYKGAARLGVSGRTVPGSSYAVNTPVPVDRTAMIGNYLSVFDSDGLWTMELLTKTPFGTDRLAQVSFTVQGTPNPRDDWRLAQFGSAENSGDGADLNDFDKDGLPNLIEYAFGLDPKKNSAAAMPVVQRTSDSWVMSFTPPSGVGGITYGAEWSPDLGAGNWQTVEDSGVSPNHVFRVPLAGKPRVFMRWKVTGQ
jgi:hypothetical protein